MDYTRLFTETQSGCIAEKFWDLPDDEKYETKDNKLRLLISAHPLKNGQGFNKVAISLSRLYKQGNYSQRKIGLHFPQNVIDSIQQIDCVEIEHNEVYDAIYLPPNDIEIVKTVCKHIIYGIDNILKMNKSEGEYLDKFRNNLTNWLDEFIES